MGCPVLHQHGGDPARDFSRLGIEPRSVIDFSVNTNPLGPPDDIENAWPRLLQVASRYPSQNGEKVTQFYASKFNILEDCILPGNGSIELIYLAPRVLGLERVAIVAPSFHDYERAATLAGSKIEHLILSPQNSFASPSEKTLKETLQRVDAIYIGNPNNPTGTILSVREILELADEYRDKYILVDEAFIQFVDNSEKTSFIAPSRIRHNVLVFHSLTKFYAIAGLRAGCAIGHPETIEKLRFHQIPWSINSMAEETVSILAECPAYEIETQKLIASERRRIRDRLSRLCGVHLFDTSANFFLARWTATPNLDDLQKALLQRGLYVRDCSNFKGLDGGYFRFAIRMPEENNRLMSAIERCAVA